MFDKPVYDMGYGSKYLDNSDCPITASASMSNGILSVTQNLNVTYNSTTKQWNCVEDKTNGQVSLSLSPAHSPL